MFFLKVFNLNNVIGFLKDVSINYFKAQEIYLLYLLSIIENISFVFIYSIFLPRYKRCDDDTNLLSDKQFVSGGDCVVFNLFDLKKDL